MTVPAPAAVGREELARLVGGAHHNPHAVLGAHLTDSVVTFRALRPLATSVSALVGQTRVPLAHEHDGVWTGALEAVAVPDYLLEVTYDDGVPQLVDDPYRYLPTLGEMDLHLIAEGRHEQLWQVLGAHVRTYGPTTGVSFAVWAPNARGVRVIGDFNFWDGTGHPMRSMGSSGVWELFVPGTGDGMAYKFAILGADGTWRSKADPMAFAAEHAPATSSIVFTSTHEWSDGEWLAQRAGRDTLSGPMSVYEVHLGSWRAGLSYRELADRARGLRDRAGLHPRRAAAGGRAPLRRLLGLPGHFLLRADVALRLP